MSHYHKYKDIKVKEPITVKSKLGGEFRLVLKDLNGRVLQDTGFQSNLITNQGLDLMADSWCRDNYYVGSGSTPAAFTDTTLESQLGQADPLDGEYYFAASNSGAPDYIISKTAAARFNAGVGTGTIREVGLGPPPSDGQLWNRQVLSTPITKSVDQVLDLYHRIRVYPTLTDVLGTQTIDGIVYDTITRPTWLRPADALYYTRNTWGPVSTRNRLNSYSAFDGDIGANVETLPSGESKGGLGTTNTFAYVNGNHYLDFDIEWTLDAANPALGIRSIVFPLWPHHVQTQFNAQGTGDRIPKDNTKIIYFKYRCSWDRR